jgi:hypothetical protein
LVNGRVATLTPGGANPHAFGFRLSAFRFRVTIRSVAGVKPCDGFTVVGVGREIPPLQRWADHPRPRVMNAGVKTPVPRALAFGFLLSAFCFVLLASCFLPL